MEETTQLTVHLVPIDRAGKPADGGLLLDDVAAEVGAVTAALPISGRVEIAYFTFAGFEGRGIASRMAQELVALARAAAPNVVVMAQTLRTRSASTRILEKLGFELKGEVVHHADGQVWEWELGGPALIESIGHAKGPQAPSALLDVGPIRALGRT